MGCSREGCGMSPGGDHGFAVGERTAVEVMKHREGERERFPGRRLSPLPRPRLCPSLPGLWPPGGA